MDKQKNIQIYEDTQKVVLSRKLIAPQSVKYTPEQLYDLKMDRKYDATIIEVLNMDTLIACQQLHEKYNIPHVLVLSGTKNVNILALNMTSATNAGGGVKRGSRAQEEELFRRTNYFQTLLQSFYPLRDCGVYSPEICVIKDENYKLIKSFNVSMVAVSAIKNPYDIDEEYMRTTSKRINMIFKIAYSQGHDVLVLGAIGCGAYNNPPQKIIEIYNHYLKKYDGCFKHIVLAVLSKTDDNFKLFKESIKIC